MSKRINMENRMRRLGLLASIGLFVLSLNGCGGGQAATTADIPVENVGVLSKDSVTGGNTLDAGISSASEDAMQSGGGSDPTVVIGSVGDSVLTRTTVAVVNEALPKLAPVPSPTMPTGPVGGPPWPRDAAGNIEDAFWKSLPLNEWVEVPGTSLRQVEPPFRLPGYGGFSAIVDAWSGAAYDTKRQRMIFQGGGHSDYVGNEVLALNIRSMTVERIWGPDQPSSFRPQEGNFSVDAVTGLNLTLTNNPTGTHTYRGISYIPELDATVRVGQAVSPVVFHHDINDWDRRYHTPPADLYSWKPGLAIPWSVPAHGVAYEGKWYVFNRDWNGYVVDFRRHTVKPDGSKEFGVIEKFSYSHPLGSVSTSVFIPESGELVVFSQTAGDNIPDVVIYDLDLVGQPGFSRAVALSGVRDIVYPKAVNWYSPWDQVGTAWVPEIGKIFALENSRSGANRLLEITRNANGFDAQWYPVNGSPPPYTVNGAFGRMQAVNLGSVTILVVVASVDRNAYIVRVR